MGEMEEAEHITTDVPSQKVRGGERWSRDLQNVLCVSLEGYSSARQGVYEKVYDRSAEIMNQITNNSMTKKIMKQNLVNQKMDG